VRNFVVVAVLGMAALSGCTPDPQQVDLPTSPVPSLAPLTAQPPGTRASRWSQHTVDETGQRVVVGLPSTGCTQPHGAQVVRTVDTVTVTVWSAEAADCAPTGRGLTIVEAVDLGEPLGGRRLVDGAAGR
jgi:hypothetical protein